MGSQLSSSLSRYGRRTIEHAVLDTTGVARFVRFVTSSHASSSPYLSWKVRLSRASIDWKSSSPDVVARADEYLGRCVDRLGQAYGRRWPAAVPRRGQRCDPRIGSPGKATAERMLLIPGAARIDAAFAVLDGRPGVVEPAVPG